MFRSLQNSHFNQARSPPDGKGGNGRVLQNVFLGTDGNV